MDAARKGLITPQMRTVAQKEHMSEEQLRQLVSEGKVVICANKKHICLEPEGIGSMLRTKINVNLGVSRDCKNYDMEMQKVLSAVALGAEAIMDLSSHGNTQPFRQKLVAECPAMIGTVPVYDSVIHYQREEGNNRVKCDTFNSELFQFFIILIRQQGHTAHVIVHKTDFHTFGSLLL